ncbi:MAG: endopeptidase La [Nitrospinae bacterium]|nr:endopeptidase La [Nitrospinota bacterium]
MAKEADDEQETITKEPPVDIQSEFVIPDTLPLLPVRDIVVFPFMILPLFVGRENSINAVNQALAGDRMMMLAAQKDAGVDNPTPEDLYNIGSVVMVIRMLKLPDGRIKILVQGLAKAKIVEFLQKEPFYNVKIERMEDEELEKKETKEKREPLAVEAAMRNVRAQLERVINLGKQISPDILVIAENLEEPGKLADLVAANLGLKVEDAQIALELTNPLERLKKVSEILNRETELLSMQQKIQSAAQEEMSKTQREYYLREQLKAIQRELGDIDERQQEITEFREKIEKAKMPEEVGKEALKQLDRLGKMHTESAEATTVRTYLEWLIEVPWSVMTTDNLDLKAAQKVLDEDHYDLEKVKERIVEYLAVCKLKEKNKGPLLCLVGPPGVGKTSLGQSVARALGRKFVRMSLGGVRDEAEIRGHRRTYIGSMPGRIIQGLKQAGTANPVYMLDEIDKLGSDFRGDPSSALLEVLDPAQNHAFVDHYLGVPFDLTNVMFITTANMVDTIPPPLLDRMEVIRIAGYTEDEKLKITRKYIIPRQLGENGISAKHINISDDAIRGVIQQYTREAGLRNLERNVANICRKVAKDVASGQTRLHKVSPRDLSKYLGIRLFSSEVEQEKSMVGVATGVAWTQTGGEVMHVEATPMKGNGKLMLTGKLGDVMKESAQAALTYIRSRARRYGIPEDFAANTDMHIHVPAGAIPKDGPSAGITMASAIVSALTGIPVRKSITMTGEITLRGRVLPIGGLKEKALAANRAGITEMIIPEENEKDLEEVPPQVRKKMKFHFARTADQVVEWALAQKPGPDNPANRKNGKPVPQPVRAPLKTTAVKKSALKNKKTGKRR